MSLESYGYKLDRLCGPTRIYNSGMARTSRGLILASRRWNKAKGHCDIVFRKLTGEIIREFAFDTAYDLEDPRLFWHNGHLWMSFVEGRYLTTPYLAVQRLARLNSKLDPDKIIDIHFGRNFAQSEKNWGFFSHNGKLHFVHSMSPHRVVAIEDNGRVIESWETKPKIHWPHGTLSGGTPPVLVGDAYVSFFHSYVPTRGRNRLYSFSAYKFRAEPPFDILGITEPIMWGDSQELTLPNPAVPYWIPVVVFPVGALHEQGKWLVSMGVNDSFDAIVEIPEPLEFHPIERYAKPRNSFFQTVNATMPVKGKAGWLEWHRLRDYPKGIIAVDDAIAVTALRFKPGIREITEEEYQCLKTT